MPTVESCASSLPSGRIYFISPLLFSPLSPPNLYRKKHRWKTEGWCFKQLAEQESCQAALLDFTLKTSLQTGHIQADSFLCSFWILIGLVQRDLALRPFFFFSKEEKGCHLIKTQKAQKINRLLKHTRKGPCHPVF